MCGLMNQREPTGPVPVVNRFDNYMRNQHNTDIAASFQTLFHRHGAEWCEIKPWRSERHGASRRFRMGKHCVTIPVASAIPLTISLTSYHSARGRWGQLVLAVAAVVFRPLTAGTGPVGNWQSGDV